MAVEAQRQTRGSESALGLEFGRRMQPTPQEARIVIQGGQALRGTVTVGGSKNATLALMAGVVLASTGVTGLRRVPRISDIANMATILRGLGVEVEFSEDQKNIRFDATHLTSFEPSDQLVTRMRGSLQLLGPILARQGRVRLAPPGGCNIGARAYDLHLKGLMALGATIDESGGYIFAEAPAEGLRGAQVYLDKPSVGATMNLLMAASLAKGTTIIENAAQEPDVEDLAQLINAMGGNVVGHGTGMITVEGVEALHGVDFTVSPDRIEGGTLAMAAAITGGDLFLEGANPAQMRPILMKLAEMGVVIEEASNGVRVMHPGHSLKATDVTAMPHPGFPTDLQQPIATLLSLAEGTAMVTDTVYEGRFRYLNELIKMGAKARWEGRTAVITGVGSLSGADVEASDLRAGAAMVLAGLVAQGTTRVFSVHHIDRGYECFTQKLASVGADIWREDEFGKRVEAV
ncbi:UDP-N-acetylglucosamine 1-carboxyvinyltransferase [Armatimonas sp.]|uniref:UDP-N-acetylglucosamine 1-carboxyvinyltransferase n=1 Tax=Armatimonas sp. TaxID=1872638 RepID=UPI003752AC32